MLTLAVHVVSDLHRDLPDAEVTATVADEHGHDRREWKWEGDIAADDCTLVGSIDVTMPFAEGRVVLDLTLECGEVVATNRYVTWVAATTNPSTP
jgi:hypothetical protein